VVELVVLTVVLIEDFHAHVLASVYRTKKFVVVLRPYIVSTHVESLLTERI